MSTKESIQGLTKRICEKIIAFQYDDFSDELKKRSRQIFADGIAVAVAGSFQEAPPKIMAENAREMGGKEQASVIGLGFKTSMTQASMINGGSMHVLDYEPMWNPPNHQLSTCLPAILAVAENRGRSGKEVLTGLVKGVEMMCCMRAASNQTNLNNVPFHPPGMVGPLGATVGAAHVMGLDIDKLRYALGIVGSRCGSLMANTGTHTKCLHCGQSSYVGLDSALLAEKGFTGNTDIFEAANGYVVSFFGIDDFNEEVLLSYGEKSRIVDPGYEVKPYPSNFATHAPINAALELREKIDSISNIERIVMVGVNLPYVNRPFPKTGLDGKFSVQYTAVRALIDGKVTLDSFTDEARFAPEVDMLLNKLEFTMDPNIPAEIGKANMYMTIHLKDGNALSTVGYAPRNNNFGKEPLPWEEHLAKLRSCFSTRLNPVKTERAIDLCASIDSLRTEEFKELMDIIRC
ncbi:MmgE/PrpD family protein [Sporomusa sp.]|uniref:MmgE/PrpD family protein n=1 Tax=Sporomusa sp. TaxID=2078658 RepID=UPI002C7E711A|nr:MmgE/PrpD family protein [Sporomusa sp.]HWR06568.1 MmgE/PrpD family protein [Sporomusa sp.]